MRDRAGLAAFLAVLWWAIGQALPAAAQDAQPPAHVSHKMELPQDVRAWYRNPDGSCVQCSIGMCGIWQNVPEAYTLLWRTEYGPAVRGGSWPGRVEAYADSRRMRIYNVTGSRTYDWMKWAARTGRFCAIGAGSAHFQTLYGWDEKTDTWYVCNNNSTGRVDRYTWREFQNLHESSGQWIVILDYPASPAVPRYVRWW